MFRAGESSEQPTRSHGATASRIGCSEKSPLNRFPASSLQHCTLLLALLRFTFQSHASEPLLFLGVGAQPPAPHVGEPAKPELRQSRART